MMKKLLAAGCAALGLGAFAPSANAVVFTMNPVIDFDGSALDAGQRQQVRKAFRQGIGYWNTVLLEREELTFTEIGGGFVVDRVDAFVGIQPIDGPGGVLGGASPRFGFESPSYFYALFGIATFDEADLLNLLAADLLFDVVVHEMAHIIGFGTLWGLNGLTTCNDDGSSVYSGAAASAKYLEEFGVAGGPPVETEFGPGTACGHWDEDTFAGGSNDIMTGFINLENGISDTTLYAFRDLGYTTLDTAISFDDYRASLAPVPVPAAALLFGSGALLAGLRRKASSK